MATKRQYRITDDVMLEMNFLETQREDFYRYIVGGKRHYYEATTLPRVVWSIGTWQETLNDTYNSGNKLELNSPGMAIENNRMITANMLVRQGFNWSSVFGILLVVKGMQTGQVLISRLWTADDMVITEDTSMELIEGSFWTYSLPFNLPRTTEEALTASVVYVTYDDVTASGPSTGLIANYPTTDSHFEPLNTRAPLPDYIVVDLDFDNNQYVAVTPKTLEDNKTLQQSLLDYFGFTGSLISVTVQHVLKYGTDSIGFRTIRFSNEDNAFQPMKIGLDFSDWSGQLISVFLATEIECNSVMLKREQHKVFDLQSNVAPFLNAVVSDQEVTVYPVTVEKINTVNNTIIDTKTETKVVPIIQPVYAEMQVSDIVFENKNVSFDTVRVPSILQINQSNRSDIQYLLSKTTVDNKFYFNLGDANEPDNGTGWSVLDATTRQIITKGTFK